MSKQTVQLDMRILVFFLVILVLATVGSSLITYYLVYRGAGSQAEEEVRANGAVPFGISHELGSYTANLADRSGSRYLKVTPHVELENARHVKELQRRNPQVRDRVLQLLRSKTMQDLEGPMGQTLLARQILETLNELLEGNPIVNVYFTEFIVQ